jgi:hypothetical protein
MEGPLCSALHVAAADLLGRSSIVLRHGHCWAPMGFLPLAKLILEQTYCYSCAALQTECTLHGAESKCRVQGSAQSNQGLHKLSLSGITCGLKARRANL